MPGRRTLTVFVIVALLAATAVATVLAYQAEQDSARDADQARAQQAAFAVRQNLTILVAGLRGASSLVSEDGEVDPDRFQDFASDVLRSTPFSRLSFAPAGLGRRARGLRGRARRADHEAGPRRQLGAGSGRRQQGLPRRHPRPSRYPGAPDRHRLRSPLRPSPCGCHRGGGEHGDGAPQPAASAPAPGRGRGASSSTRSASRAEAGSRGSWQPGSRATTSSQPCRTSSGRGAMS